MEIEAIIRENIRTLQAYVCARDEYSGEDAVFLDANENPFDNGYNRYPDPYQRRLKSVLADLKQITPEKMIIGNGSDEIIDLLIRSLCNPGEDHIIIFYPGYSMYEVSAAVNAVDVKKIALLPDWGIDREELDRQRDQYTKIIFLCTPNNPTGNLIPLKEIESICRESDCLVVVDEAYIDFTDSPSALSLLGKCNNLFVLQTLSKAWGMAGLRLGIGFTDDYLIRILNKVKAPYNVGILTQQVALQVLEKKDEFYEKVCLIKEERDRLLQEFKQMSLFRVVYPSEANFILVTLERAEQLYDFLSAHNVIVRLRNIPPFIEGGIRISVGKKVENDRLLELLKEWNNL